MRSKAPTLERAGLACATALLLLSAHPVLGILPTPWGDLAPSLELEAEHDSNVLGNGDTSVSSWVWRARPELRFTRSRGAVTLLGVAGLNWERFSDAPSLDGVNPSLSLEATHAGDILRSSVTLAVREGAEVDVLRADRVRQRTLETSFAVNRSLSGKWGLGMTGSWRRASDTGASNSQEEWQVGPRATYAYNRFLDLYAGYSLRSTSTEAAAASPDTEVSGLIAGVDGRLPIRLLPRVNLTASAGWQTRSGVGSTTRGGLVGDASIEYELSGLTVLTLTAGQDFLTSLEGDSGRQTRLLASLAHAFTDQIRCTAGVTWSDASFDSGPSAGQSQQLVGGFLRADWRRSDFFTWFARAATTRSQSETSRRDYDRTTLAAGVRITY